MAITLKPCPFCGGAAVMQEGAIKGDYKAECGNLACIGSYLFKWHRTKEEAAEAWNRRTTDEPKQIDIFGNEVTVKPKATMKAWLVKDKDEGSATVVFAETRGKARAMAMHTDACEDVDFCDIEVRRRPQLDKYYREGKKEMDWYNSKDRIALVKDAGFVCDCYLWEREDCDTCPAKDYCDRCQDCLTEEGANDE